MLLLEAGGASGLPGLSPLQSGPTPGQGLVLECSLGGHCSQDTSASVFLSASLTSFSLLLFLGEVAGFLQMPLSFIFVSQQMQWVPAGGGRRVIFLQTMEYVSEFLYKVPFGVT